MRTILPLLTVSFGIAAIACSGTEDATLTPAVKVKDTVSTTHATKADVITATNEFACAAEVNAAKTQVTVPTALYDKVSSTMKAGATILIRGFAGNASNTGGLVFKITSVAAGASGKTVLTGTQGQDQDGFSSLDYSVSASIGSGAAVTDECVAGVYKSPTGATDPGVPNSGSDSRDLPVADGKGGVRYEIDPQPLIDEPFSVDAVGGGKATGRFSAALDAAYFALAGKFDVKGSVRKVSVRADLAAELDAKVLASVKLALDSSSKKPAAGVPLVFEKQLAAPTETNKVRVPWGYIEYRQSLVIRCNLSSADPVDLKLGAEAKGSAGVFAEYGVSGFDHTGKDGKAWKPEIAAKPLLSATSPGSFKGTCEGEVRVNFKVLGRDKSYVATRVYINVDDNKAAPCPVSGGLVAKMHIDPPWPIATKEFEAKASYLADGGACVASGSATVTDACSGKPDGWLCDTTKDGDPARAYQCQGGKQQADKICPTDGQTCKSVSAAGVLSCS